MEKRAGLSRPQKARGDVTVAAITAQSDIQAARAARKRENLRAWTDKNRAYVNEQAKLWYHAHKEEMNARRKAPERREQQRQYHEQRYTNDPAFRERQRHKAREWREQNLELARARQRARYHANREERKQKAALYRADPARRAAARQRTAEWIANNPDKYGEQQLKKKGNWRKDYLRSKYGLSWDEYQRMLAQQEHRCAICRDEFPEGWICVDHCHSSDRVRDLLCPGCNTALGLVKERPDILRAAAAYLERHEQQVAQRA